VLTADQKGLFEIRRCLFPDCVCDPSGTSARQMRWLGWNNGL